MTRTGEIEKLADSYGLNLTELICCIIYFQFENKTFAHRQTIGLTKRYKHPDQAAINFFNRGDIQTFVRKEKQNFLIGYRTESDAQPYQTSTVQLNNEAQKDHFVPLSAGIELTKDNIKQVLEQELSKTTDPEKRTALLIRVADFLSLNDSGNVEFEKPVI